MLYLTVFQYLCYNACIDIQLDRQIEISSDKYPQTDMKQ